MGCPPQIDLTRKLIRKFFKNNQSSQSKKMLDKNLSDVVKCWQKNGFMSQLCSESIEAFNVALNAKNKKELTVDDKPLVQFVLNQLNPPIYPKLQKGRYKDHYTGYKPQTNSIFDGIIMEKEVK